MKKLILILLLACNIDAKSQDDKTVTLVVSGQGKTQDEAKQNALRSAIEQAFGTFISSKTEILNENLVKDEIVSIANGNIQKFDILSEVKIPEGGYATTLKALVSVSKLTNFCESKGVEIEFKGSLLAANIKQQILNEKNEVESIKNITNTCKIILDQSCDFEIVSSEPRQYNNDNNKWAVPINVNVKFNKNIKQFNQYLVNSINGLSMSADEVNKYKQLGKQTYKLAIGDDVLGAKTLHFRTLRTIVSIIDLIYYTKNSVLNFKLTNGITNISSENLIKVRSYNFKITIDNLNPIFNVNIYYSGPTFNGPNDIFFINYPQHISLQNEINEYRNEFYYNGGRKKSNEYNIICNEKYTFLNQIDKDYPSDPKKINYADKSIGYYAVISLFDYKQSFNSIVSFYFEDILSLSELEKIKGYKINSIKK